MKDVKNTIESHPSSSISAASGIARKNGKSITGQTKNEAPNSNFSNTIQREIAINEFRLKAHTHKINDFVKHLDEAVQKAYTYVLHVPKLGSYADLDGHTAHWVETWKEYDSHGTADLIHAAFGYAVESIATLIYLGDAPEGLQVLLQQQRPGTRPDVVLIDENTKMDVAWLDITAAGSEGHIHTNKLLWDQQDHIAEITYPSISNSELSFMKSAPGVYDDKIDKNEFFKKKKFAEYLYGIRREHWKKLGDQRFNNPIKVKDPVLNFQKKNEIIQRLSNYFGIIFNEKMAASTLYAMDISGKKFGLDASVNKIYGESILLNHDPGLPKIPMPKESIPYPLPLTGEERRIMQSQSSQPPEMGLVPIGHSFKESGQGMPKFTFGDGFDILGKGGGFSMPKQQFNFQQFNIPNQNRPSSGALPFLENSKKPRKKKSLQKIFEEVLFGRHFRGRELEKIEMLFQKASKSKILQAKIIKILLHRDDGELIRVERELATNKTSFKLLRRGKTKKTKGESSAKFHGQLPFGVHRNLLPQSMPELEMENEGQVVIHPEAQYKVLGMDIEWNSGIRESMLDVTVTAKKDK